MFFLTKNSLRFFMALRLGVEALILEMRKQLGVGCLPVPPPVHERPLFNWEGKLQYVRRVERLVFEALLGDQRVAVKFTQEYCLQAHQLLTAAGFAPKLHLCDAHPVLCSRKKKKNREEKIERER